MHIYLGATGTELCPVAALLSYLAARGGGAGPLFRMSSGGGLNREQFVSRVRTALYAIGVDNRSYAGHSFRTGAATMAAEQGVEDSLIKLMSRWDSSAYQLYIRSSRDCLSQLSRRMVRGTD